MAEYTVYTSAGILNFTVESDFRLFCSRFTEVEAGGGLVRRPDGKCLMIRRHGKWDLPKGHREDGENIEQCAIREVEEETGVSGLSIIRLIGVTHHTYNTYGPSCIKHTSWYEMASDGDISTKPQSEEGITSAEWVDEKESLVLADGSYPSISFIVRKALTE